MEVDPVACIAEKFGNMVRYLQEAYPEALTEEQARRMQEATGLQLIAVVRAQLLPHMALVEAGDLTALADKIIGDEDLKRIASCCATDSKIKRYLQLFCELAC